jgi:hypothetical protein
MYQGPDGAAPGGAPGAPPGAPENKKKGDVIDAEFEDGN